MNLHLRAVALAAVLFASNASAQPARLEKTAETQKTSKGEEIAVEQGRLFVPENRHAANSRTIAVGFVLLRAKTATPKAPLFFLQGGPGSRAAFVSPRTLDSWRPFLDVCDVVLVDQRGTNDSTVTWQWDGPPPLSYFVDRDSALRHVEVMNRRAWQVFRERGVDLAGYTTEENADDFDALREALGYPRFSILGFSYGTHLGISILRRHGPRVESAILIGTEGPDETFKMPWVMDVQLRKLALIAAADSLIGARVPDLVALYDRVTARLEREPVTIPVQGPPGTSALPVRVGAFGLDYVLRADLGDASDLVVVPRLLWKLDRGDTTELAWFVRKRAGGAIGVHGMNEAMDYVSGASPSRLAAIAEQAGESRFADVINMLWPQSTVSWNLAPLSDEFRSPLVTGVRTLFISGEFDMNTPPYQAEQVRWGMPNSTHLIVANAGHEQTFWQNDTAGPVIVDFLKGQDVSARRITYPKLRFVDLEGDGGKVFHPSVRARP